MRRKGTRLIPARIVAPGTLVRKELDSRGWTQEDLARIMDRPVQVISEIVAAKKQITPETALGLAGAFGTSAEMWLEMEAAYRLKLARKTGAMADVERRSRIYSAVPVKELVRRGWIEDCDEVDDLQAQVEAFLDVSSLDELRPLRVAARRTTTREPDPRGVLAWTRRVEQLAASQKVGEFDAARLQDVVDELLALSEREDGPIHVADSLKAAGICFVIVTHLQRTFFDGAVVASNGNPVVALTLRHDRLDSFWFTLMHEIAHLVRGHEGGRLEDLDGDAGGNPEEVEADALAAEWLVPGELVDGFASTVKPYFSRQAIWSFAQSIGRHPAIVLGRLQHGGHVSRAHLRGSIPKVRQMLEPFTDVVEPIRAIDRESRATAVAEPVPVFDPEGSVLEWLRDNPGWNRPSMVKQALGLDRSTWSRTIRTLVETGRAEKKGQRRGTKYRAVEQTTPPAS